MAGRAGRRTRRALRAVALLGGTVMALGLGAAQSSTRSGATADPAAPAASVSAAADVDTGLLRPAAPRGYGTVAARAAQAAAEAQADAATVAARAAATKVEADAAAARRTPSAARTSALSAASSPPAGPVASGLPLGVDPGSRDQVVTVVAHSATATTATLTAWERRPSGWTAVLGPVNAWIGEAGVGRASEATTKTPAGTFTLTEAFGRAANPGTALRYRVVDGDDWWVSDVTSPRYNQYAQCARNRCDFNTAVSENLYGEPAYQYAAVIDYNRGGTPGAGSAFFLHVSNNRPTAGCVAIDVGSLRTLLRWLEPASAPVIAIGVG